VLFSSYLVRWSLEISASQRRFSKVPFSASFVGCRDITVLFDCVIFDVQSGHTGHAHVPCFIQGELIKTVFIQPILMCSLVTQGTRMSLVLYRAS
jgi:hypothetical protein